MRALASGIAMALLISGCGASYEPPDTPVVLKAAPTGAVVKQEIVTVRASFLSGGALSELNTAKCTVSQGANTQTVTAPSKVQMSVAEGLVAPLIVTCEAYVGPKLYKNSASFDPLIETASSKTQKRRHYPKEVRVNFIQ